MPRHRTLGLAALLTAWMALSSCGGGGGGGGSLTHPVSGAYGWVVRQPDASAPLQLSLVHPGQPDTEYRFTQRADLDVSLTTVLYSGTVNSAAQEVHGIQPHTLLMFQLDDIRSVSLQADGAEPVSRSVFTGSLIACDLLMVANDYANPLNSRIVVLPAVPPGGCGFDPTFETPPRGSEGNIELRFSASGELVASRLGIPFERPFGVLRDPASLAPRAWLYEDRVVFWNDGEGTSVPLGRRSIILNTDRSVLLQPEGGGINVLTFPGGTTINETTLDPTLTAGSWVAIGYDAEAYYLFGGNNPLAWTVIKITRSSLVASVLATFPGVNFFERASVGKTLLYVSLTGGPNDQQYRVFRISKAGSLLGASAYPAAVLPVVHTSPSGVHMLELKDTSTTDGQKPVTSTALRFIDENDNTLYSVDQGFPMARVEPDTVSVARSTNTTQFLFAANTIQNLADATLTAYDTTTRHVTALGKFPGAAEYGTGSQVWVDLQAGPASAGAGYTAAVDGQGGIFEASSKVFSFDLTKPNSLRYTKVVK